VSAKATSIMNAVIAFLIKESPTLKLRAI
jgi:hypothetical protein